MVPGLRRLSIALTLMLGISGAVSAPADPLTIQGSSTFAADILLPTNP